ncbi:MAG: glycosyltransferase [Spirochaetales bacterium]|nr:glycosyltransferase [Spirochaetales bacterium]
MTILVISSWHAAFDGRIFYKQCKTLANIGDVHLLTPGPKQKVYGMDGGSFSPGCYDKVNCYPLKTLAKRTGIIVKILRKIEQIFGFETLRIYKQSLAYIKKKSLKVDIIHVHEPELISIAHRIAQKHKAKLIYDAHEMHIAYPIDRYKFWGPLISALIFCRDRKQMPKCDAIIAVNEIIRSYHLPLNPEAKCIIIENSSIISEIPPIQSHSKLRLIHEGALSFSRGLKTMVELFKDPEIQEKYELHYVGKMGIREKKYLNQQPESVRACFVDKGWVQLSELPKVLHGEIGLILMEPKMNNILAGPPNKLYNYLAMGIPVLSVDLPASRMIIERFDTGEICLRDPKSIKAKLLHITKNIDHYRENCNVAHRHVIWSQDSRRLVDLYNDLLTQN